MDKKIISKAGLSLLIAAACWAGCHTKNLSSQPQKSLTSEPVSKILKQIKDKTNQLSTYQCRIEYLCSQPLFESQTLRGGLLYYQKFGKKSKLRINLETLKQDDEKEKKYIEQFIFDSQYLTHIDYAMKQVRIHQLTEPNEPNESPDAFALLSRNFPIIGFTQAGDLKKEFEIKLVNQNEKEDTPIIAAEAGIHEFVHLHLKVKPGSVYKDDYTSIDLWIDKKLYLPAKIIAVSTEKDIYQIKFLKPKVNKELDKKTFDLKIPKGFTTEKIPLKKELTTN